MTDNDAQAIWEEIVELKRELKAITIERQSLSTQANELRALGEELHVSANKALAVAAEVEALSNGNGKEKVNEGP